MAKDLAEFTKAFATIKGDVTAGMEQIKKNAAAIAQTSGVMHEGVKEVGLRVQKLKDMGETGASVNDFMSDPEVKSMMGSVNAYMKQIEAECNRIGALHAGSFKKTIATFWDTKKSLEAEIAARKKAVSTKLGTGNKSLPDLEKLLAEMNKYKDAQFASFEVFTPETAAEHRSELDKWIKDEMSKTKAAALSAFQKEMDEQALNVRVLNGNVGKAKTTLAEVLKDCAAGEKAHKAKQLKPLMDAKLAAAEGVKELSDMAGKYERAQQDQWIMSKLRTSKDKGAIESGMKSVIESRNAAKAALNKLAALKL
ncbi:MAG: hypothetical protein SFY69_07350 [Planctomycetota bacterium]|nr:hypothetical protein [Planctomycetota bacterium]